MATATGWDVRMGTRCRQAAILLRYSADNGFDLSPQHARDVAELLHEAADALEKTRQA